MTGHPGFYKVLDEIREMHERKSKDYGYGVDPFANVRASEGFGVPPWLGAIIRLNDKITRIKSFVANGELANESLRDSLIDIPTYGAIALALYDEANESKDEVRHCPCEGDCVCGSSAQVVATALCDSQYYINGETWNCVLPAHHSDFHENLGLKW